MKGCCNTEANNSDRALCVRYSMTSSRSPSNTWNCPPVLSWVNCFQRPATALIRFPPSNPMTVTNVQLDLIDDVGNVLSTIFNKAPGGKGNDVQVVPFLNHDSIQFPISYVALDPNVDFLSALQGSSVPNAVSCKVIVQGMQGGNPVTITDLLHNFPRLRVQTLKTLSLTVPYGDCGTKSTAGLKATSCAALYFRIVPSKLLPVVNLQSRRAFPGNK
jgi:hypothetical protein